MPLRYLEAAMRDWASTATGSHYLHGNFLKFLGRMEEAVAAYERSLAINPDLAFSH